MRYLLSSAACAALMVLAALPANAGVVIDSFDTAQRQDTDPDTSMGTSGTASGTGILGGERDVSVSQNIGFGYVGVNIAPGGSSLALYNEDSDSEGSFRMSYDGADGNATVVNHTGLGGIDLTAGGSNGFLFQNFDNTGGTNGATFKLTVYTDASNFFEHEFFIPENTSGDVFIPFSAFTETGNASFSNVGAIVWDGDIDGNLATDFNVGGFVTGIPEPSTWLLLTLGAVGLFAITWRRRRIPAVNAA